MKNWEEIRFLYESGYETNLKILAGLKNVSERTINRRIKKENWIKEKIAKKVFDKYKVKYYDKIEKEYKELNDLHFKVWKKLLKQVIDDLDSPDISISDKKNIAQIITNIQAGQRLAAGMSTNKTEISGVNTISDLILQIKEEKNNNGSMRSDRFKETYN